MARGASSFGKKMRTLGCVLVVTAYAALMIGSSVNVQAIPGMQGATGVPDVPSVDQTVLNQAAASEAGQRLKTQGYQPKSVIEDKGMVAWLDEQEKHDKVTNPGPYVVFSTGQPMMKGPGGEVPADMVVDATQGVIVALSQGYTDKRGAACYNSGDMRALSSQWVNLSVYLQGKNLDVQYQVTHADLPQLPASLGTVQCYTFVP